MIIAINIIEDAERQRALCQQHLNGYMDGLEQLYQIEKAAGLRRKSVDVQLQMMRRCQCNELSNLPGM